MVGAIDTAAVDPNLRIGHALAQQYFNLVPVAAWEIKAVSHPWAPI